MSEASQPGPKAAQSESALHPSRSGNFRSSVAQFLGALILLLIMAPFVDVSEYGRVIDTVLMTLVLIFGVLAVGRRRRTLVLAALLVIPAMLARWIHHFEPQLLPGVVENASALLFICFLEYQLLLFIFRAPRVNSEVLCAGISGYLLLGILWTVAYLLVSGLNADPAHPVFSYNINGVAAHPVSRFEAYYFSFITLSTVGYGDITPLSNGARTLAMIEAMTGTLYMAVLISRLVALYSSQSPEPPQQKN